MSVTSGASARSVSTRSWRTVRAWYRDSLLPRVVFLPFLIARLVPIPFGFARHVDAESSNGSRSATLCIEAGVRGWESIEFKELYASACEYLGEERVHQLKVTQDEPYLRQVKAALDEVQPSHYVYDPRTGSQKWGVGLWQAVRLAFLLHVRGVIAIVLLTDLAVRSWRAQGAVVTAKRGTVVGFLAARAIYPIFPHRRLVAPSLMPLSQRTLGFLNTLAERRPEHPPRKALFVGSLYEPRTSTLRAIAEGLEARGFTLEIRGRELGSVRISDLDYWSTLSNAAIVVTTASQLQTSATDWTWVPHLIYRYIEAIACGTLLVAPEVPGVRRFLSPGEHFVSFSSASHAIDVIEYYLINESERKKIAQQGRARAQALVAARSFWTGVDVGLGRDSLT